MPTLQLTNAKPSCEITLPSLGFLWTTVLYPICFFWGLPHGDQQWQKLSIKLDHSVSMTRLLCLTPPNCNYLRMTNSDTDLWTRLEAANTATDIPAEPAPAPSAQQSDSDATSKLPTTADSEMTTPSQSLPSSTVPSEADASVSKSQRIRNFLTEHPDARNKDVVDALSDYGVKAADVANVKTIDRKKADSPSASDTKAPKIKATKAPKKQSGSGPRAAKSAKPPATREDSKPLTSPAVSVKPAAEVVLSDLEAGLAFIEQTGGIEKAQQVLELIARIRSVKLS